MNILSATNEGAVRRMRYVAQNVDMAMGLMVSMMMGMAMRKDCAG